MWYTDLEKANSYPINDTCYAIRGHINPSLEVYVVVDAVNGELIGKYHGVGFTWNKNRDTLYYVVNSPYFSTDRAKDKIVDNKGNIYYEADLNTTLTDKMIISEDEQTFAFFVNDLNERKLYIAEMNKNKKLEKKSELSTPFGDIEFKSDKTVKVTPPEKYDIEKVLKEKYGN